LVVEVFSVLFVLDNNNNNQNGVYKTQCGVARGQLVPGLLTQVYVYGKDGRDRLLQVWPQPEEEGGPVPTQGEVDLGRP
jgi:hypothetical protein